MSAADDWPKDLYLICATAIRLKLKLSTLAVLSLLFREPQMESSEVMSLLGMCRSSVNDSLRYLLSKDIVKREPYKDQYRREVYVYSLTDKGRDLAREFESYYRACWSRWQRRCHLRYGDRSEDREATFLNHE